MTKRQQLLNNVSKSYMNFKAKLMTLPFSELQENSYKIQFYDLMNNFITNNVKNLTEFQVDKMLNDSDMIFENIWAQCCGDIGYALYDSNGCQLLLNEYLNN